MFSPRVHTEHRRHLLRAATALPTALLLASCGGGGNGGGPGPFQPPGLTTARVTDRRVRVAPDVSLHVRDWQSDRLGGTTFVLLPGFGATAALFNSLAPALAQRGRAIAISCRGFGQSDKPLPDATHLYDTETLVNDVHEVLQALDVGRIVLGGHSIAGNQVTRFAGRHPERVRGLVYLDTNFDYTTAAPDGGEEGNPALQEPSPTAADNACVAAAIAFNKRINQNWSPPMEADLLDKLDVKADGSVQINTPNEVGMTMYKTARLFSPDYRAVHTPALVLVTLPGDRQHMFPWLPAQVDAKTEKDASDMIELFQNARTNDAARLLAALPAGSRQKIFQPANHVDFFIEHQAEVLGLIDGMAWL
ncbi:alpha/beta fold hydrolase [Variovorax sp. PAMC26660]|uniref:alpha/beta fold hydrolase n=1 Tax=Variovorax sp. PAMC26660 TaxID=2762322 RepID=UPI00164DA297|nr:alpha/beta hydrolase [Variovorax sp. PAMC26660]QNK68076.1 alpha/beta fold hydrolase [Variovorax sp. PAMC26660]